MIKEQVTNIATTMIGAEIPKPEAKGSFLIKGMGMRRGENALIYTIPSHTREKPYQKGITLSEFEKSYEKLKETGYFKRSWFNENLKECVKEGSCNFTTIGGIFQLLGYATYSERGVYQWLI